MHDIRNLTDPIKFGMTGFEFQTRAKSLIVNNRNSLGFFKSPNLSHGKVNHLGLIRAFAEIDLEQVKLINDLIINKRALQKSDFRQIEPETTVSDFEGETFFSLFSE